MAKKVFFSFHYQDVIDFRANVVRNHGSFKLSNQDAGYYDSSMWEKAKKESELALKRLINTGLKNTSNTCVLIGTDTYSRPWVRYEILKSFLKENYIFGVHINSIKGKDQRTKTLGRNPFLDVGVTFSEDGKKVTLWEKINTEWVEFTKIENKSTFNNPYNINDDRKGEGFNLSHFYSTHDWKDDDGYNNFSDWVN